MQRTRGHVRFHQGAWRVSIAHDGRRIYRTVRGPDTQAGRRRADRALDLLQRQHAPGGGEDLTVTELLDLFMANRRGNWSYETERAHALRCVRVVAAYGDTRVRHLTPQRITEVNAGWKAEGVGAAHIHGLHNLLAYALNDAVKMGLLESSPAAQVRVRVPAPRIPSVLDISAVHAAVAAIENPKIRVAALVALATGARRAEIAALRWRNIDFDRAEIKISHSIVTTAPGERGPAPTKTGSRKAIAVDPWTLRELAAWRHNPAYRRGLEPGRSTPWVFHAHHDATAPWGPGAISYAWAKARQLVELDATFHDLRHLHATTALAAGVPVHAVAQRLGHKDPTQVIATYGHAMPAHDRLISDLVSRSFGNDESNQPTGPVDAAVEQVLGPMATEVLARLGAAGLVIAPA